MDTERIERIRNLEAKIGPAPIVVNTTAQRQLVREWLFAHGVALLRARCAKDYSLAAAYNDKHTRRGEYLRKMLAGDGRGSTRNRYAGYSVASSFAEAAQEATATSAPPQSALDADMDEFDAAIGAGDNISGNGHDTLSADAIKSAIAQVAAAADTVIGGKLALLRGELETHISKVVANTRLELSADARAAIRTLAADAARETIEALAAPRTIEIKHLDGTRINVGRQHESFDKLLRLVGARNHQGQRLNVWLTGPTGSGKTTAAEQVARALAPTFTAYAQDAAGAWTISNPDGTPADLNGLAHDAPFGADSSLDADYKIVGFKDANGRFHWTTFLRIFVFGGVYVADEIDNWMPSALVAINAALANGWISTPIGLLRRHPDCCIIAAANTWGTGATNDYVGRTKLDAATINRFPNKLAWPIDERLERAIAADMGGSPWCDIVQKARAAAKAQGLQVIFSPRNTIEGIAALRAGFTLREVIEMNLTAGLRPEQAAALGLDKIGLDSAAHARARLAELERAS